MYPDWLIAAFWGTAGAAVYSAAADAFLSNWLINHWGPALGIGEGNDFMDKFIGKMWLVYLVAVGTTLGAVFGGLLFLNDDKPVIAFILVSIALSIHIFARVTGTFVLNRALRRRGVV